MHNSQCIMHNYCVLFALFVLFDAVMHCALNYSSILPPKPMRHLFTNLPHFFTGDLEKRTIIISPSIYVILLFLKTT